MKTEISRDSHQPEQRYSGVYQQQGRMLTDADWNELVDILKHRLDDALGDVVGSKQGSNGGIPRHRALKIIPHAGDHFMIQPGHVYVDGMAARLPGQTNFSYNTQPDFPAPPPRPGTGNYLLYVDVWERTVTQLMDARLRDAGLHGADTCTRKQTLCQIKSAPFDPASVVNIDPENALQNPPQGNAKLSLLLLQKTTQPDPCDPCADTLNVDSKPGNYLFRVELHEVLSAATGVQKITLKWSSENGAEQFEALPDKQQMPAGFISDKWVYEFFDMTTEKHLGVHHATAGWQVPQGVLSLINEPANPYTVPNIAGSTETKKFIRRWDGYATFNWDSVNAEWLLSEGVNRGVALSAESSASKAEKVLKLDAIELRLQLLNRLQGRPVTAASLSGSAPVDLIINGTQIGAADPSARVKAAAINTAAASVLATASTRLEGQAPTEKGTIDAGKLKINSLDIGPIVAADTVSAQLDVVINAINSRFSADPDFVASKTPQGAIVLTASDGRNIAIEVANAETSRRSGLASGSYTTYGRLTLVSPLNAAITIAGAHPEYAGFDLGTTAAVRFVAGDYWLAEVREAQHQAGDVLLSDAGPQGIKHHYLNIAKVLAGTLQENPEIDRKYAFPALTEMTRLFIAAGDGQEVMPGQALPQALRVGVANGEWPVAGASVRFQIEAGGGSLSSAGLIKTSASGIAECVWTTGSAINVDYRVKATLVDPDHAGVAGMDLSPPVYFYANLLTADQVAYQPGCVAADENTVHGRLVADSGASLQLGADNYYLVSEVLDALLCKLRARHIPYDASHLSRWLDVNQEEGVALPETVQEAIDGLLENLHSEDIKYTPGCVGDSPLSLRSTLGIASNTSSRLNVVLNKLFCDFRATHLPLDRGTLCDRLADLSGAQQVDTVQDAINALCRTKGGGCCTITISAGDDLRARLMNEISAGADAHICITQGEYLLSEPVLLEGRGHITIQGCGNASVIRAPHSEAALIVSQCMSVVVRDLSLQSYRADDKKVDFAHLNGTLTIRDVDDVLIESVSISCPHAGQRMASCLTVAHSRQTSSVRVRGSRLYPGDQQLGILLINVDRARIEDNEIKVQPKARKKLFKNRLRDKKYRLSIRKIMLSDAIVVDKKTPSDRQRNVEFDYGRKVLRFHSTDSLVKPWQSYLNNFKPENGLPDRDLIRRIKKAADHVLLFLANDDEDNSAIDSGSELFEFKRWFDRVKTQLPAIAAQGIVCAGRIANDICISGNSIQGVAQGVHIGLSHNDPEDRQVDIAGRLLITENKVVNYLSEQKVGQAHALYTGNFESLHIENNHLQLKKFPPNLDVSIEGIRVYGYFGRMLQIRGNRLNGYDPGIIARALKTDDSDLCLWQVENNLLQGASGDPKLEPNRKFISPIHNPH